MALTPKSFTENYERYKNWVLSRNPNLTDWSDGSINDILNGASNTAVQELMRILLDRYKLTLLNGAEGDDLEYLAVDHYGDKFARPDATKSLAVVQFSRPNTNAGNVNIPIGTIVKTAPDANGESQRFEVIFGVTLTGTTINASVRNLVAGPLGDVGAGTITQIETALTDPSIIVTNLLASSGGSPEEDDATYRETIRRLLQSLKGATATALKAVAEEVPGVELATIIEFVQTVIEWNEATEMPVGNAFKIARAKIYIADANGAANQALIDTVDAELENFRACGVFIDVVGAIAFSLNWSATIQLNAAGPNYATLQNDTTMIVDSMRKYIQDLAIGQSFNRNLARQYMLNLWGPSGSNDLVDFVTNNPTGDVVVAAEQKIIPNVIGVI